MGRATKSLSQESKEGKERIMINYHIERYTTTKDGAKLTIKREAALPESEAVFALGESPLTDRLGVFLVEWAKMESEYKKALKNNENFRLFFYASKGLPNNEEEYVSWCQGRDFTADEAKTWNDCPRIPTLIDLFRQVESESEKR